MLKKLISLLCAFLLMFTTLSAFAESVNVDDTAFEQIEEPIESESEEPEPLPWETNPELKVVKMSICATANSLTGHVWLYFVNLTDFELPIGRVTLLPKEEMSVGSLRNTRADGGGTYYNGEAYMGRNLEKICRNTTSLSMDLTYEELEKVSSKISSKNFYNMIVWNCGNFAAAVWNTVSSKKVFHVTFPVFTILWMKVLGGKRGQVLMKKPEIERVFKQINGGVKNASPNSFKDSCVG